MAKKASNASTSTRAASTPEKRSSETSDAIVGYIHDVSPDQISKKGSTYFSFYVQDKDRVTKAICFSPEKRKLVESKAESCSPCKVSKYRRNNATSSATSSDNNEDSVLWINKNTRIDDAPDTVVDFPYTSLDKQSSSLTAISDVQSVRLNELITVKGFVTFGENIPQSAGSMGLIKLEGYLIDHSSSIRVTIWNDQIKEVKQGNSYLVENIRLRQYLGAEFLSSTPSTKFTELTTDEKKRIKPSNELVNEAVTKLKPSEVRCKGIKTVEIVQYYSCVKCNKRIQSRSDSVIAKCEICNIRFLLEKSKKNKMARVIITVPNTTAGDQKPDDQSFSLFDAPLADIINKYNTSNPSMPNEDLSTIDEEKLSELLLVCENITFVVNASNNVTEVKFEN